MTTALPTRNRLAEPPARVTELLQPIRKAAAAGTENLFAAPLESICPRGVATTIDRYLLTGPGDRGSYLRVGIFAGIHGDEPSGSLAAVELLRRLHKNPEPALGYELFVYPVCNPWGFERNTRWLKSGADMNREFWRGTSEPGVLLLEGQLLRLGFDGIIALHSDDTSAGLYGFVKGHQLTRHVLEPALESASRFLPRNFDRSIDNFQANSGIIEQGYPGILGAPPVPGPKPFEIVFETPNAAPLDLQIEAHIAAVESILGNFRSMIAQAQNI